MRFIPILLLSFLLGVAAVSVANQVVQSAQACQRGC